MAAASVVLFGLLTGLATATLDEDAAGDEVSMLQRPFVLQSAHSSVNPDVWPILVPLSREVVPIRRGEKVVAHKTSYAGAIQVGTPAQNFRVVFDTGSGHVVLPSSDCTSQTCTEHRRYNISASHEALAINVDGSAVPHGELCDQVTIGYGTGEVTGEFARDKVCLGTPGAGRSACVNVSIVMAVEMTPQPFQSFNFDGIFGLSLDSLAVSPEFSFFNRVAGAKLGAALQFGVFLAGADASEEFSSEIALGGYNHRRLLTPLSWAPVASAQMGYWQVKIKEVRIGNRTLDICQDGSCRGVVDTGTSHLGVPGRKLQEFASSLAVDAADGQDCSAVEGPSLEIVLEDFTLSLSPRNYMRPLPLQKGTVLGRGVGGAASAAPASTAEPAAGAGPPDGLSCAAKIMPVNLQGSLGQNVFILGEPLLHRYYTVYDWEEKRIGFGLSATPQNRQALGSGQSPGEMDEQEPDVVLFMQVKIKVRARPGRAAARADHCDLDDSGTTITVEPPADHVEL